MNDLQYLEMNVKDKIAIISINRHDKLNALNIELLREIKIIFELMKEDRNVSGIILTGKGDKSFVAGADIGEIANLNPESAYHYAINGQEIFKMINSFGKPVIAAVNGYALGGGCELAISCHIRVASENALFGFPEVSLGLIPGFGGTQRLTSLIGKSQAMELILTGDKIDAIKAQSIGLINYVVRDRNELMNLSEIILNKILKNSPISVNLAIQCINEFTNHKDGFEMEAQKFSEAVKTGDFKEGTLAFMEKRKPIFKGN